MTTLWLGALNIQQNWGAKRVHHAKTS